MIIFKELLSRTLPDSAFDKNHLPTESNIVIFRQLVYGFQSGAECLDDMDKLVFDAVIKGINNDRAYGPKTFGNFLRSFDLNH